MPDDYQLHEIVTQELVTRVRRIERNVDALLAHLNVASDHDNAAEPAALKLPYREKVRSWWRKRKLRKRRRRYSAHGEVVS